VSYAEITYRPLTLWTWPQTEYRKPSPFRSKISDSLARLRYEVQKLGATDAVLQVDVPAEQFRRDGQVFANAVWHSPRVVLSLESRYGSLAYPCDRFQHWHDNVRAIALGLEALRTVDRYGITRRGEQYTGWKALPSQTVPTMSVEIAARILANVATTDNPQNICQSSEVAKVAARIAKFNAHPDRNNGGRATWDNVETAISVLSSHHGVTL